MNGFRKKLAIIGANEYQNRLILKAKELGVETHVFSWGGGEIGELSADNFYQVDVTDKQEILEQCKALKVDGVCSIASDLTNLTVNYIRERLGHIKNSNHCLELTTNKYLMRDALKAGGSPIPDYRIAKKNQSLTELSHFPYIVKPVDRSGSRGVNLVHNFEQLQKAVKESIEESFLSESIIEEFIEGEEYSIESYSKNGSHFILQITEKYTSEAPRFIEKAHLAPALLESNLEEKIKQVVAKALTDLKVEFGASHSEIKVDKAGEIKIIEIGSRMGGDFIGSDLVVQNTGIDFLKLEILNSLQEPIDKNELYWNKNKAYLTSVIFSFNEKHYNEVQDTFFSRILDSAVNENYSRNVLSSSERYGYHIVKLPMSEIMRVKQLCL